MLHNMFHDYDMHVNKIHELTGPLTDRFYFKIYASISVPGIQDNSKIGRRSKARKNS